MAESREFSHLFYTQIVGRPAESVHILDTYFAVLKHIGVETCLPACSLVPPEAAQDSIRQKLETKHFTAVLMLLVDKVNSPFKLLFF